ncbi:MAG: MCE family protein [Spirochaetaceae bacterium]|nr:MCE family protein [Spirochaetaceae bacterium]
MKFRIKYADRIVGLFVVLAAVLLCVSVVVLGGNQRWFARNYHFTSRFASGGGIAPGTAINMKGFQVGKIERITLNADNEVDVDFVIYDTYLEKAKHNSILELVTSPIGLGSQLLFHPGKGEARLEEGAFVPTADSPEGQALLEQELVDIPPKDDTITRLLANVNPLLENVNKTVVTVNRTLTEVNRALAGQSSGPLGQIVGDAADTMAGVEALVVGVKDQAQSVVAKADDLVSSINRITLNLEATTEALRDPTGLVPKLLDPKGSIKTILDDKNALYNSLIGSLAETQKTLRNIQSMTTTLNAQMPTIAATLEETRTAIGKAQDVLEGLKNNPLLRGGIPERRDQAPVYQSLRDAEL